MIVFIAGMPRSGSMWTYNITKALMLEAGKKVLPEVMPPNETAIVEEALAAMESHEENYCIKTHFAIPALDPSFVKIICNYRDVRDAMISFMKFMRCDFEQAIKTVEDMMGLTDHYFQMSDEYVLKISYDKLIADPFSTALSINKFLNLEIEELSIQQIVDFYSKDNVTAFVETLNIADDNAIETHLDSTQEASYSIVGNYDGTHRLFDKVTGFQSNHITNTEGDEWRQILSTTEQEKLMALTSDWLVRYGYLSS